MMILLVIVMSLSMMIVLAVEHLLLLDTHSSSDLRDTNASGLSARYNELFLDAASSHLLLGLMNSSLRNPDLEHHLLLSKLLLLLLGK